MQEVQEVAKPYSPWLFRLGAPAGPNYLLQTLRGTPRAEALKQWQKEDEAAAEEKEAEDTGGAARKWPFTMKLECRHCERLRRLTAFTTERNYDDLWSTCIARGADLACNNCSHLLGLDHTPAKIIFCEHCEKMKRKKDFSEEMQTHWMCMRQDVSIHCKRCAPDVSLKGRQPVDEQMIVCCGPECNTGADEPWKWSELHSRRRNSWTLLRKEGAHIVPGAR